jgi:hypothetical protein
MANLDGRSLPLISMPYQERSVPFGGVARDVRWMTSTITESSNTNVSVLASMLFLVDVPFSFFGDLVTLPKVLIAPCEVWHGPSQVGSQGDTPELGGTARAPGEATASPLPKVEAGLGLAARSEEGAAPR